MATVHLGLLLGAAGFSRTVAIKRLHDQYARDPEFVAMLLDEARLASTIRHPNVVPTLDVVADASELLVVMDYVEGDSLAHLTVPVSIALLVLYVIATWYSLQRHRQQHASTGDEAQSGGWSFRFALVVLGVATVATALVAEVLVGSLEVFAEKAGLSDFFVAAVIVAIVGNAAEHGGAVIVA